MIYKCFKLFTQARIIQEKEHETDKAVIIQVYIENNTPLSIFD